ncbi:DUF547 domain-containing protein [Marinobacter lacisalsi]|uniref:DUF547 domain-containing protein n=1 Tax=Marinobacter lacisalsi TaxID=475979 RepID=A0ABV8QB01_9GAMM
MRYRITLLFAGLVSFLAMPAGAIEVERLFSPYQKLLDQHLIEHQPDDGGLVTAFNYDAALAHPDTDSLLDDQRKRLAKVDPSGLDDRNQAIAFWLNAYNFFMIDQILTERPDGELISSVWDYGGRVNPFTKNIFERPLFNVGGEDYSLDQMEKDILLGEEYGRKGWKEARVHFAVNCASVGCPPLRQQIYTADNLEQLLAENTRLAFNTPRHLEIAGSNLRLTELFDWYKADFEDEAGSVRAFVRKWADDEVAEAVSQTSAIEYIDYDWSLNRPGNFPELRR